MIVTWRCQVRVGLGEDLDHVHAGQVGGGLDVDAAIELAVAEVDAVDLADRDRRRVARLAGGW